MCVCKRMPASPPKRAVSPARAVLNWRRAHRFRRSPPTAPRSPTDDGPHRDYAVTGPSAGRAAAGPAGLGAPSQDRALESQIRDEILRLSCLHSQMRDDVVWIAPSSPPTQRARGRLGAARPVRPVRNGAIRCKHFYRSAHEQLPETRSGPARSPTGGGGPCGPSPGRSEPAAAPLTWFRP